MYRKLPFTLAIAIASCGEAEPPPAGDTSFARDAADISRLPDAAPDPDPDTADDVPDVNVDTSEDADAGALDASDADADAAPDVTPDAASDADATGALIGTDGGRFDFAGGWIEFPPGALSAETRITVTQDLDLRPDGFEIEGGVWRFEPSPTTFEAPVSVCLFVEGIRPANMTVHWSRPLDPDIYDPTISRAVDGAVCGRVHHFSVGFLGRLHDPDCDGVDCTPTVAECAGSTDVRPSVLGSCVEGECAYPLAPTEPCDEGLVCLDGGCVPPPRCGDGEINQETEVCDGEDLVESDCRSLGFETGTLSCTDECELDDSDCAGDLCAEIVCDAPPEDVCDGSTAVHYGTGECLLGACEYPEDREDCTATGVCADGACVPAAEPGDLVITEIMANPAGDDDGFEWFEVLNVSERPIPLTGISLRDDGSDSLTIASGPIVLPGEYAVLAEADGATLGVTLVWSDSGSMALSNTEDEIELLVGDVLIDRVAWGSGFSPAWPRPNGASMSLDPSAVSTAANDESASWCEGLGDYGVPPNTGTPGVENPPCDRAPRCGDGFVDGGEECDDGNLEDGDGCQSDCTLPSCAEATDCDSPPAPTCDGDFAVTHPTAECDTGSCVYGEAREDCSLAEQTCVEGACADPPVSAGELVITEFMANVDGDDTGMEWFEVFNATDAPISLDGFTIRDDGTNSFDVVGDFTVLAADYFVIAATSAAVPDGVDLAWEDLGESYALANGDDEIVIEWRGLVIDRVAYDRAWDVEPAESLALRPGATDADSNDDALNWCAGSGDYGVAPNVGSPGEANAGCPIP